MSNPLKITVSMQAKHGLSIDVEEGEKLHHVRVFNFENTYIPDVGRAEMPVTFDRERAATLLVQLGKEMLTWPEMKVGEKRSFQL